MKLTMWLKERELNARRLAAGKTGEDRAGWLEDADYLQAALAAVEERDRLHAEANKSERRAITFGDIVHSQVVAMQAAVLEGHLKTPAHGLQWIVNTLTGPGHLPDLDEARELGGAQAWWDRETAKHEEFRREHPGPAALGPNDRAEPDPKARGNA